MNLAVPAAVAVPETAFLDMPGEGAGGFGGFEPPARTGESAMPAARRERRLAEAGGALYPGVGGRVLSEGKGWEYPLTASSDGFRADVRHAAAGTPLGW